MTPQLFALMLTSYNLRAVGTCKANRIGFDLDKLNMDKLCERGIFVRKVDSRLGMVMTRWKDSKILQIISTVMQPGIGEVRRRQGATVLRVKCPNDVIMYQNNMGGVDRGDQHRVVGAGFANVAHFKKWYKKVFLGIADFSLLQTFTAWNLSAVAPEREVRGGVPKRNKMIKWEFYSVVAEEMMTYCSSEDDVRQDNKRKMDGHVPIAITKNMGFIAPTCMICSMEEGVMRNVLGYNHKKARSFSRRISHLSVCSDPNCKVMCHSCCPEEAKVNQLPQFSGMTCFEIAHQEQCKTLFVEVNRKGHKYIRSITKHSVVTQLSKLYQDFTQDSPQQSRRGRPRFEQQNTSIDNNRGTELPTQASSKEKSEKHADGIRHKRTQPPRRVRMSKPHPARRSKRRVLMIKRKAKKR